MKEARKVKSNKRWQKIFCIVLVIQILLFVSKRVFAAEDEIGKEILSVVAALGNGLIGLYFKVRTMIPLLIIIALYFVMSLILFILGNENFLASPGDLFFNKIDLLKIDFINAGGKSGSLSEAYGMITTWFGAFVGLSAILLLAILIYISIRAVIATTAGQKKKYYDMFVDWLTSIVILALLSVIIVGAVELNNRFVDIIGKTVDSTVGDSFSKLIAEVMGLALGSIDLFTQIFTILFLGVLIYQTLIYTKAYIRRFVKIAFLITIAPLITITYSIDKLNDNKSQAVNNWMSTFLFEVFIQTFHAIIYATIFSISFSLMVGNNVGESFINMGTDKIVKLIFSIVSIKFIDDAENIIRNIFNIKGGEPLKQKLGLATMLAAKGAKTFIDKKAEKEKNSNEFTPGQGPGVDVTNTNTGGSGGNPSGNDGGSGNSGGGNSSTSPTPQMQHKKRLLADAVNNARLKYGKMQDNINAMPGKTKGQRFIRGVVKGGTKGSYSFTGAMLGFTAGFAQEDLTKGVIYAGQGSALGKSIKKYRDLKSEKEDNRTYMKADGKHGIMTKEEKYMEDMQAAASETVKNADYVSRLDDGNFDINTADAKEKISDWASAIQDKTKRGVIMDEYKEARKQLVLELKNQGYTSEYQINNMISGFETSVSNLDMPTQGVNKDILDTNAGKEFARKVVEKKQSEEIDQYNNLNSEEKDLEYNYKDIEKVINESDNLEEMRDAPSPTGGVPRTPAKRAQKAREVLKAGGYLKRGQGVTINDLNNGMVEVTVKVRKGVEKTYTVNLSDGTVI